jgi:hypothetical protein
VAPEAELWWIVDNALDYSLDLINQSIYASKLHLPILRCVKIEVGEILAVSVATVKRGLELLTIVFSPKGYPSVKFEINLIFGSE